MKNTKKHGIITVIVAVMFVVIGMVTGDGYNDSWIDYISIPSYVSAIAWTWLRLNNFLNVEKWF